MKRIELNIENCETCPFYSWDSVNDIEYCKNSKAPKKIPFNNTTKIPDWCPLPDIQEKECEHPFASVQTRCMGEINHCLKCGKNL